MLTISVYRPGETYDVSKVHEDIQYSEEDDKAIDDWVADHVETTWHSLGTCGKPQRHSFQLILIFDFSHETQRTGWSRRQSS